MTIDSCNYDIKCYQNLKQNINSIISHLNSSSNNLDKTEISIKNAYKINNGTSYMETRVLDVNNDIYKISNYLKNSVLPEIDRAINNLDRQIFRLEEEKQKEIEMKRQKETEKLAKQSSNSSLTFPKNTKVSTYGKK